MTIASLLRLLNPLFMIAMPIALAIYLTRRFPGGWRLIGIGAATFIFSQVGHIPFNIFLLNPFLGTIDLPDLWTAGVLGLALGLSAGIFEEFSRWAAYRFFAKDARTWGRGLVLGAGHGGVEAAIMGALVLLTFVNASLLRDPAFMAQVPPDQVAEVTAQVEAYWAAPWHAAILGAVERLFSLVVHLSLSILVLQAFTRRNPLWVAAAVLWHTFSNAIAVFAVLTWNPYITEALIGVVAVLSAGIIYALRQPDPEAEPLPPPLLVEPVNIQPPEETEERLEGTRYL